VAISPLLPVADETSTCTTVCFTAAVIEQEYYPYLTKENIFIVFLLTMSRYIIYITQYFANQNNEEDNKIIF